MTRTFVFIGKNIIFVISCLRQPPLLVAGATTLPAGKRVTGFSDIGPDIYRKAPLWAG